MKINVKVIKRIENTDFSIIADSNVGNMNVAIRLQEKHGIVLYVTGLIEGDKDALMCIGSEDGSEEYVPAFHKGYLEFEIDYYKKLGRNEDVAMLYETMVDAVHD